MTKDVACQSFSDETNEMNYQLIITRDRWIYFVAIRIGEHVFESNTLGNKIFHAINL